MHVAIDGIDGAGKSTLIGLVTRSFPDRVLGARQFSWHCSWARDVLLRSRIFHERLPLSTLAPAYEHDLLGHAQDKARLGSGIVLLQDRSTVSTVVYDAWLRGTQPGAAARALLRRLLDVSTPDYAVLLDVDPVVAEARLRSRAGVASPWETVAQLARLQESLEQTALDLITSSPSVQMVRLSWTGSSREALLAVLEDDLRIEPGDPARRIAFEARSSVRRLGLLLRVVAGNADPGMCWGPPSPPEDCSCPHDDAWHQTGLDVVLGAIPSGEHAVIARAPMNLEVLEVAAERIHLHVSRVDPAAGPVAEMLDHLCRFLRWHAWSQGCIDSLEPGLLEPAALVEVINGLLSRGRPFMAEVLALLYPAWRSRAELESRDFRLPACIVLEPGTQAVALPGWKLIDPRVL